MQALCDPLALASWTEIMQIGELARATSTKVTTIRFYEQIGLVDAAARTGSGRRTYQQADVERLNFIRNGRRLGFSIDEIRSFIQEHESELKKKEE